MGGCSVVGCRKRFVKGTLHFYRFPKESPRREAWIQFTRKGEDFVPKGSSTICELHFNKDCFLEKKDRVHLKKDAVPTIYQKETANGQELVHVPYDTFNKQYYGPEAIELLQFSNSTENEELIVQKRQQRIDELKILCRFCFCPETNENSKCVPVKNLESYKINFADVLTSLGLARENELCGEVICEQCFQKIVEFDLFRKKCQEAQEDIKFEIQELDNQINAIRLKRISKKKWQKEPTENFPEIDAPMEILEEHLVEETEYEEFEFDQQITDQAMEVTGEEYIEEIHDGFKIIYQQIPGCSTGQVLNEIVESQISTVEETIEDCQHVEIEQMMVMKEENVTEPVAQGVDEYIVGSSDDIIKNPERNRFCFRIYECFFCKMNFAGRKTFVAHKCPVTEVKCDQCDKVFNRIQAYNSHVSHVHGSLPVSKHFCPLCKTVIISTMNQFKQHRRQCNKDVKDQPIECEICSKMCNNLKGYTVHKLFHDTRNFTTSTGEKIASEGLNVLKGSSICELCGKSFQSAVGYRMHKRNVHKVGQAEGETFICHLCSKTCSTKRSLFDHMRNTHRVQESQCNICEKVFRTKILLKKHMIYHDETKRTFICQLCPEKPGYFTNVALKRHQISHVGCRDYKCDVAFCESAYTSNHQLKQHKLSKHGIDLNKTTINVLE